MKRKNIFSVFLHLFQYFLIFLVLMIFMVIGGTLGGLFAIENDYATPIMNEVIDSDFFSCDTKPNYENEFISENCPIGNSPSTLINLYQKAYPNLSSMGDSFEAIIETINSLDIPDFPTISSIPNYQELIDIVEESKELDPLGIGNIVDYGGIAIQFIEYFADNGQELLEFLASTTISEVDEFVNTARHSYLATNQIFGYIDIITKTKIPVKNIIMYSALGMIISGIITTSLIYAGKYGFQKLGISIRRHRRKPKALVTELDVINDMSRRDMEFDRMVRRYKKTR